MEERTDMPPMTSHKAIFASIATLLTTLVLSFFGLLPTSEEMITADLEKLLEALGALATVSLVPGLAAYFKRNYQK